MKQHRVTRRPGDVEGQYMLRTREHGPIATLTKDYSGGPSRPWTWKLADGIRIGHDTPRTGFARVISDAVEDVEARLNAYGIRPIEGN